MALNKKYTYDELGEVTENGLDIALFPQIREAIATRIKEIFGNDIDLSTASADGQYINMEALIFNNMYKLIQYLYNNLNPNIASGKYLDILSSYRNIQRKGPTKSTAQVLVKYTGATANYMPQTIEAQDRNGNQWTWTNPRPFNNDDGYQYKFNPNDDPTYLTFTCNQSGPVEAYAGTSNLSLSDPSFWIDPNFSDTNGSIYLELSTKFLLYQTNNAIIGTISESDESLRNRGSNYFGGNSQTTQSALETAIYNYAGVQDVYVVNNNTGQQKTLKDGAVVENHDIYIAIKYKENVNIDNIDSQIADIIYNKLTPGVITQFDDTSMVGGEKKEYSIELLSGYTTNLRWKVCTPVNPTIVINFTTFTGYIQGDGVNYSNYETAIINALNNYFNNLELDSLINPAMIQIAMMSGDLKTTGTGTFISTSATINGNSVEYQIPLTYLKYNKFVFNYVGNSGTLTISFDSDSSDSD